MTISANKITRQNVDDTGKKADKPEKRQDKPEKRQDGASRIMRVRAKKQEKTIKKPGRKPSSCGQPDTVAASAVVPFQRMQWHSVAPTLYTPPPASPVGERRLRRKHPGTQCHWLHAHARAAVPLAPAAALLGFLGLLLLVFDHLGMGEHRLHRAGHVVGLMACLAGR